MASNTPGLRKIGRFWHFSLMINGQRAHGSTRATDLATAKLVLEEERKILLHGQIHRSRRTYTVKELIHEWLSTHSSTFSRGHLASAECALRLWVIPSIGTSTLARVSIQEVAQIRSEMLQAGRSGTYVNNTIKTLRAVLNYAVRNHYIPSISFNLPKLKVQRKPRAVVPVVRVQEFLTTVDRQARNPHIPVLIRVMLGLGLREAEVLGMRWEWFSLEQRTYTVGKAKGKEARVLPVPSWVWDAIHAMPKTLSEWVFPADDGKPHRPQFSKKVLQRVCAEMGVGNVTHHRLRASFASMHAEAGTPITDIQGMLGHKSITTTMIYVEQTLDAKRRAQDALSKQLGLV